MDVKTETWPVLNPSPPLLLSSIYPNTFFKSSIPLCRYSRFYGVTARSKMSLSNNVFWYRAPIWAQGVYSERKKCTIVNTFYESK